MTVHPYYSGCALQNETTETRSSGRVTENWLRRTPSSGFRVWGLGFSSYEGFFKISENFTDYKGFCNGFKDFCGFRSL